MGICKATIETTKAKQKGDLRMTTKEEISNVAAVKSIFLTQLFTLISNKSTMVSLNQERPRASTYQGEEEEDQEKHPVIKARTMKRWI